MHTRRGTTGSIGGRRRRRRGGQIPIYKGGRRRRASIPIYKGGRRRPSPPIYIGKGRRIPIYKGSGQRGGSWKSFVNGLEKFGKRLANGLVETVTFGAAPTPFKGVEKKY